MAIRKSWEAFEEATTAKLKNTLYLLIGDWGRRVFSILFISAVARLLGPQLFGIYGLAQDLALLFAAFFDFGLSAFLIREVAREPDRAMEFAHGAIVLRLLIGVIVFPIGVGFAIWSGYSTIAVALVITQIGWVAVDTLGQSYRRVLMAQDKMVYEGILNTLTGVIRLALAVAAIWAGLSVIGVGIADLVSATIILGISAFTFYRVIRAKVWVALNWRVIRGWVPTLLPLISIQFLIAAWARINTQILIQYDVESAVGILTAVNRLIFMILPLATYQVAANLPTLSRYATENSQAFVVSASKQLKWIIYLGFATSLVLCLGARPLILIIFGPAYSDAISLLQILAWQPFLYGISYSLVYTLIVHNEQSRALLLSLLPMAGYLALCIWLVPLYSYIGSGWATIVGFVFWSFCLLWYSLRHRLITLHYLMPSRDDIIRLAKIFSR